ncbi:hypothetical protein ACS8E9_08625 [Pseudomonas neustonica]|uniref:hypothetical protein n=1 Tax=Pseudomonas neustonica TaxID=2487346 RepID=UPI003F4732DE
MEHAILLVVGLLSLGYMALSSYLSGWHPMQGVIFGSLFYGPGYAVAWFALAFIFKEKVSDGDSGGIT